MAYYPPSTAGTPAGSNGDLQKNSSGAFGALTPGTGVATALANAVNGAGGFDIVDGASNLTNKTTTTQSQGDNSTKLATTAYVDANGWQSVWVTGSPATNTTQGF